MASLFTDPVFLQHETGPGHPESPARLAAILAMLNESGLKDRFSAGRFSAATENDLQLAHDPQYVRDVAEFIAAGGGRIESDTMCGQRSNDVARLAVGAAMAAVDSVMQGAHRRAAVLARPPGHHALTNHPMGFCLYANIAIAARHAQRQHGVQRVLIVDWDVHHGNGTQDIFYEDPSVTFFSVHRFPFYPGTGDWDETGTGAGLGTTFNLPLAFGVSRHEYRERFHTMLNDACTRCRPELILLSAGYDAHAADPIGSLALETEDFADLTRLVSDAAWQHCDGRLVSLLEGGYDLTALAESVRCHLETLLETERR